ncbi:DUF3108 domain-containing protein [Maricaulaceae bacterium EIL42A08]|nr:DUF3108 domain-containing protein [Maricaulaceae bacterium EIL42A08]
MSALRSVLFTAASALFLSSAAAGDDHGAAPSASDGFGQLYVEYVGSVLFLNVADITINARIGESDYSAAASFTTAGLAAWFDDTDIEATTIGYVNGNGLEPWRYQHTNFASNKGRVVGIDFEEGLAVPDVNPPFGSMGEPPASDEDRQGALDPITVLLNVAMAMNFETEGETCNGRMPIFDGKSRYDLRFVNVGMDDVRTRAYRGEAIRCQAFVEPISGYDPGDRPTDNEIARPVTMWLAPIDGAHVPVRFRANTAIGNISIQARRVSHTAAG